MNTTRTWRRIISIVILGLFCVIPLRKALSVSTYDPRFAVGGSKYSAQLPLKWLYDWGWEIPIVNTLKAQGHSVMFLVGHPDSCPLHKYTYHPDGTPNCNNSNARFDNIHTLAQRYPHSYWQIGNEDDIRETPQHYAKWYKTFYNEIKKYDPNAKIGPIGLGFPRYNLPHKWIHPPIPLLEPTIDPYIQSLITADLGHAELIKNNAWVILWRKTAKDLYGSYPVVDFWAIHPYPWNGHSTIQEEIQDTVDSVTSFRNYLGYIGEGYKPIWVTEFSILGGPFDPGCTDRTDCDSKSANDITYMQGVTQSFIQSKTVQKWFWFYSGTEQAGSTCVVDKNCAHDIMYDTNGTITSVGQTYLDLASQYRDTTPPQITNLWMISATRSKVQFSATTSDDNSGVVEYWYSVGTKDGEDNIAPWRSTLDLRNTFTATVTGPGIIGDSFWVNMKVADASDNVSSVKSVNYTFSPNQGYWRDVPMVNNAPDFAHAGAWSAPLNLAAIPGSGDIQTQDEYVYANNTKLRQAIWRGNQGFWRDVPLANNAPDWAHAGAWSEPIAISALPGSGDIQTNANFIYPNRTNLKQSFWRGNQGYSRDVPMVNDNPDFAHAGAWAGPTAISALPGSGDIQTVDNYIYDNNTKLRQAIWRNHQGFWRDVPMVNNAPDFVHAGAWSAPIALSALPGQGDILISSSEFFGNTMRQAVWRTGRASAPACDGSGNGRFCEINGGQCISGGGQIVSGYICHGNGMVCCQPRNVPIPTGNPADLNNDKKVDIADYTLLVASFGKTGAAGFTPADIDKTGKVDIFDYNILMEHIETDLK